MREGSTDNINFLVIDMIHVNKSDKFEPVDITDLEGIKGVTKEVLLGGDEGVRTFAMRRFTLEKDGYTPFHKHDWEHEVFILEGQGKIKTDDGFVEVEAGDAVYVPPNEEHQFLNDGEELQFLCLVPNKGESTIGDA